MGGKINNRVSRIFTLKNIKDVPTRKDSPGTSWFSAKMIIFFMCGSFSVEKGSSVFLFHSTRAALSAVTR